MSRRWVEGVGGCFDDKILHLLAWNLPVNIFVSGHKKLDLTWTHFLRKVEGLRIQVGKEGDELHGELRGELRGELHGELHPGHGEPDRGRGVLHHGQRGGDCRLSCTRGSRPCRSRSPACGWCVRTRMRPGAGCDICHSRRQFQTRERTLWRSRAGCRPAGQHEIEI